MTDKIRIYNTLTNKKEVFEPIDPSHVTMYVCGPTVYNYAHVGNARPVVVFDTLARLLRHDYPKVTYARNITDIDDKIIEASRETGEPISAITEKFQKIYEEDMGALNAELPDVIPKATDYIGEMIAMTQDLIEKGFAYEAEGHVLFQVSKMDDYGQLSGRAVEDLIAGARVNVADYKRESADFILWKPSSDEQPGWDSPWGRGRPGWHLECSAMISKNFGTTIDIHGGGQDLIFPHHENEIAQSKCAHGGAALANYWMHNGYLTVNGEKMSKSLGNFITVHDVLYKMGRKAGESLRLLLMSTQYRKAVDFSYSELNHSRQLLDKWYRIVKNIQPSKPSEKVLDALRDDLNLPKAITEIHTLYGQAYHDDSMKEVLLASLQLIGLLQMNVRDWLVGNDDNSYDIGSLIAERLHAKKNKNFARADEIRDELANQGIALLDHPDGTTTWEKK